MRTTIELEDRAMAIARATAAIEQSSLGTAISRLILKATEPPMVSTAKSFPQFQSVPGHVITDELVAQHRDES